MENLARWKNVIVSKMKAEGLTTLTACAIRRTFEGCVARSKLTVTALHLVRNGFITKDDLK
jgi:hypothetical protein